MKIDSKLTNYNLQSLPYQCNYCDSQFINPIQLKKHNKLIHKEKKPFQCNYCGKKFSKGSKKEIHSSIPHEHGCSDCNKKFVRAVDLKKHNLIIHKVAYKWLWNFIMFQVKFNTQVFTPK